MRDLMNKMRLQMKYEKSDLIANRMHELIPGGSHTYSKGDDQFPLISPRVMSHAKGAYTWDLDGNKFVDWPMGNRVMILGHADQDVNNAVFEAINNGTNFTRPGIWEYKLAEYLISIWKWPEMVKFGKNGSDVTTAAIKISRAYTNREYILVCEDHPFFSIHDWFISSTPINKGTTESERKYTIKFKYNDREGLKKVFEEYKGMIACVIMEPVKNHSPYVHESTTDYSFDTMKRGESNDFLSFVRKITNDEGSILIFDEMISGMRFSELGAHSLYNVEPDLVTFGKSIANGFSCSVIAGKKSILELGGIKHKDERVFLLSQTHGSEVTGLAATYATIEKYIEKNVKSHVWSLGKKLKKSFNIISDQYKLRNRIEMIGFDCNPQIICKDEFGNYSPILTTYLHQELINRNILIPWISITYSHGDKELNDTLDAYEDFLSKRISKDSS